jgi:pyruvate,water dikinase
MYLRPNEVGRWPRELVGGKAWWLARLASVARVPHFRVIVPDDNLEADIGQLGKEFANSARTYAVRSSAAVEDSHNASYAGLFSTILGATPSQIPASVEKVIQSADALRVREFQKGIGADTRTGPKMSVVVQEMINASASGVALSFAPNSGRQDALIEAIFGLGEPLVGGRIPPDSWTIDRESRAIVQYRPGTQVWKQMVEGRVVIKNYERNLPKLTSRQLSSVADMLFIVEDKLPLPEADVEFCFDSDALYALQARPLLSR